MALVLSDTDCVIDYLKGRAPHHGALWRARRNGELAVSAITVYELFFGAPEGAGFREVSGLLADCTKLSVTEAAAQQAALDGAYLARIGQRLDVPDLLIAGVAKTQRLGLVTRNVSHFGRVQGLTLLDPG